MTEPDAPVAGAPRAPRAPPGDAAGERWADLQSVVDGALDLPPEARLAYLAYACDGDLELHREAMLLVEGCERAERASLFATSAAAFAAPVLAEVAEHDAARAEEQSARMAEGLRSSMAGRYDVERELGRGGMATVFLARDLRHDRRVAVKVMERNVGRAGAQRFMNEIRTTAGLAHPHILAMHDSGESDGLLYYVMPYVEGETLRARLARDGALPLPDALRLLRELADALAYAHGRGIIHRDLKPENVLLSGGHAIVADFGIARAVAAAEESGAATLTTAGIVVGTPAYMSPEQAAGDVAVDRRADLYALGVVAYEVLAGVHPFGARTRRGLVAAHLKEAPLPLEKRRADVPRPVAALVMQLLAKDPDQRPQSAESVLHVLDGGKLPAVRRRVPAPALAAALTLAAALAAAAARGYVAGRGTGGDDGRPAGVPRSAGLASARDGAIRAVAVLPFENMSASRADDYLSDGMSDELAYALGRLPGLRLAGRTSAYAFKDKAVPAQEIGRVLGVDAIVSGTVRRAGPRLRVTAQLVSTADGKVVWDSVFERRSSDVFAVQDDFTHAMARALAPALQASLPATVPDRQRGTASEVAYDVYLKGRYYWMQRGAANLLRAIGYFRQAIAVDPRFARAHAGLAMAFAVLPVYVPDPRDTMPELVMASARRAMALDSSLADAHLALAYALDLRAHFLEALAQYRAGAALEPSSVIAHHWLGISLLNLGRTDEALVELRHASQLDPLAAIPASALATSLLWARHFAEAESAARHALALDSTLHLAVYTLGLAQAFGGQPDSAVATLEHGLRQHPDQSWLASALVFAYAAAGRWADAERVRERLRHPGTDPIEAAQAEYVFGNRQPLVRLLTSEAGQRLLIAAGGVFGCNPRFDPLWSDPRFRTAMRALAVQPCPLARPWPIRARRR